MTVHDDLPAAAHIGATPASDAAAPATTDRHAGVHLVSHVQDITPADPRGGHELLRLAAGMAPLLYGATGSELAEALAELNVHPAHIERVVTSKRDLGVIALIDGALYALGRRSFLEDAGIHPRQAEARVGERIERSGSAAFYVVAVARAHCLGVFGVSSDDSAAAGGAHS